MANGVYLPNTARDTIAAAAGYVCVEIPHRAPSGKGGLAPSVFGGFGGEASDGVGDVPKTFQILYLIILHPIQPTKRCPKSDSVALPLVAPT